MTRHPAAPINRFFSPADLQKYSPCLIKRNDRNMRERALLRVILTAAATFARPIGRVALQA